MYLNLLISRILSKISFMNKQGKIVINADVNVWPHEIETAKALASSGKMIEFVPKNEGKRETSPDILMDGKLWEIKSPKSSYLKVVQKRLREALHQTENVVFDSRRMKKVPDNAIRREVEKWSYELRSLQSLIYVSKTGNVEVLK